MSEFLIYQSEDGKTHLSVLLDNEELWLSQKQLTDLFGKAKGTVSEHIKHIFEDGELAPAATVRLFRTVQTEGRRTVEREVEHYNLDMVLAVGYRVRSQAGTRFRQWASAQLKEFIIKGFALDDARLKNPDKGRDYFDELARRLQDIRTSERRFYQKITDIYATSVDYDPSAVLTKGDAQVAKNYLNEGELRALNNLAEQYLIFAEGQAMRRVAMTMQDWISKLDGFLSLNDRDSLQGAGQVSAQLAKAHADGEFAKFRSQDEKRFESDFDRMVKALPAPLKGKK